MEFRIQQGTGAVKNRIRPRTWVFPLCLAVLAGGCSSGSHQEPAAAVPTSRPVTQSAASLPIERYLLSDGQMSRIVQARNRIAAQCVRRFGLDWNPVPPPAPQDPSRDAANSARRYGLTDPAEAARFGYHVAGASQTKRPAEPPLSSDQRTVLSGRSANGSVAQVFHSLRIPTGGCIGEANARISGDPERLGDEDLPSRINVDSYRQSMADPRVVAAFQAWSGCMKRHGYDYADPTQAPGKKPEFTGPGPTTAEIAVAVADVSCKKQTGLVAIWSAVDITVQNTAIKRDAAELATVKRDLDNQVRAAASAGFGSDGP